LLYLDYETYYDAEYNLTRMATPNYILDPRFETIMVSVAEDDDRPQAIDGPDFSEYLKQFDPKVTTTVTFNSLFDNCILAWRYGFVPQRMLDPMGMAWALHGHLLSSVSLRAVADFFRLGAKGDYIQNMKGKHRAELRADPAVWKQVCDYANQDVALMRGVFKIMLPNFPISERKIMDRVLRCAVEPAFQVDKKMLEGHLVDLENDKLLLLQACGLSDTSELMSTNKFSAALEKLGVPIEYKTSLTGKQIPALAKTDDFMQGLLEHDDPQVQALAAARLGAKSTIEQTRTERLISIVDLPWPERYGVNPLPVPLKYGAAHTHRLGGEWKINLQNLPSGRGGQKTKLRKAIIAHAGHKVIVIDLAQIEARITAWLVGEAHLLHKFANKIDPYAALACIVFTLESVTKDSLERFIGKSGVLGLGFGCGADRFYNMVLESARRMGMDMTRLKAVWTPALAQKTVDTYRQMNRATVAAWKRLDWLLETSWCGNGLPQKFGPVVIERGAVLMPNGMRLNYVPVSLDPRSETGLTYRYGKFVHKIYGSKFLENIVQALARVVIMNAALRLWDKGYKFKLQEHDALAFVVPDADVDNAKRIIYEEVTKRPSWAPDLPLSADIGVGQSYGDAK
jgi:DNA polymerase